MTREERLAEISGWVASRDRAGISGHNTDAMRFLLSELSSVTAERDELREAIEDFIAGEAKDGGGYACTFCDMGGSGYSSKGDGHHDDVRHECPVVKFQAALSKVKGVE